MDRKDFGRRGLDLMYFSGAASALSPLCRGLGAIILLNNVRPGDASRRGFNPSRERVITPGFLEAAIAHLRQRGFDLLSFRDALTRLRHRQDVTRPFIAFTIDGAHRDSLVHAWPVFRKSNCPFTLFVSTAAADGKGELWWRGLEAIIAGETRLSLEFMGIPEEMSAVTDAQKQAVWRRIYWPLRSMNPYRQRTLMRQLSSERGIDLDAICRAEAMSWHEIRTVSRDPLCTIGAQTVHHFSLAGLSADDAEAEIVESARRIEIEVGQPPAVFRLSLRRQVGSRPARVRAGGEVGACRSRHGAQRHAVFRAPGPSHGAAEDCAERSLSGNSVSRRVAFGRSLHPFERASQIPPLAIISGPCERRPRSVDPPVQVRSIQRMSAITSGSHAHPAAAK